MNVISKKIKGLEINTFILLILYKLSLDIVYVYFIVPYYSYTGMDYSPSYNKYAISTIIFIIASVQIIKIIRNRNSSMVMVLLINLVYFIPGCTFYAFSNINKNYFIFFIFYWLIFNFLNLILPMIDFGFKEVKNKKKVFYVILSIIVVGAVFITGKYNGFKLHFSMFDVYGLRSSVSEMNLPGIIGYFKPVASSLIPIGAILFMKQKRFFLFTVLVFVQLFLFSFGGHKTTLFVLIVAILAVVILKENYVKKIVPTLILINFLAIIETLYRNELSYIAAFFHRRNMFTTNLISSWYYEFFSANTPDYLQQSILKYFGFNSSYDTPIPHIISLIYTGNSGGANNGMVGDAFANFGWVGLVFYPLMLTLAFRFYDYCSKGIDPNILFVVSIIFTINFINSSFFTVLLTHGFIFITIALYFFPRDVQRTSRSTI